MRQWFTGPKILPNLNTSTRWKAVIHPKTVHTFWWLTDIIKIFIIKLFLKCVGRLFMCFICADFDNWSGRADEQRESLAWKGDQANFRQSFACCSKVVWTNTKLSEYIVLKYTYLCNEIPCSGKKFLDSNCSQVFFLFRFFFSLENQTEANIRILLSSLKCLQCGIHLKVVDFLINRRDVQLNQLTKLEARFSTQAAVSAVQERIKNLKIAMQMAREVRRVPFLEQYCTLDKVWSVKVIYV